MPWDGKHVDFGSTVYLTFKWEDGGKNDYFERARAAGYRCYRWDRPAHKKLSKGEQTSSIKHFLNYECEALIVVIDDPEYAYTMSTAIFSHVALNDLPPFVLIVDPHDGSYAPHTNSKGEVSRRHPLVRGMCGTLLNEQGMLLVATDFDKGLALLEEHLRQDAADC